MTETSSGWACNDEKTVWIARRLSDDPEAKNFLTNAPGSVHDC